MKKFIDVICIISIVSSFMCIILLVSDGIMHNGVIVFSKFFGFLPWPMEWFIINIPMLAFGNVWLILRYGKLIKKKFPLMFGKYAFYLLILLFISVGIFRLFYRR